MVVDFLGRRWDEAKVHTATAAASAYGGDGSLWWGTTDIGLIESQTYDYEDDYQLPKTNFAPMLDGPAN